MTHEPEIGAIFADRASAESAVADLRGAGLADEHLGVAVHDDRFVFEEQAESSIAHGVEKGATLGVPMGALAGMIVMSIVAPAVASVGVGGILAAGAATGALAGGFWGTYLGLTSEEHVLEDEWDWEQIDLGPEKVLVVADQHGDPDVVRATFLRHGGEIVEKPSQAG